MSALTTSPLTFRKFESAKDAEFSTNRAPRTISVTSARYAWLLRKPQLLSLEIPMLLPVMATPPNDTAAFTVGTSDLVRPCQKRYADLIAPVTPLRKIVPVPVPRMPP